MLDRDGHLTVAHRQSLDVYGDQTPVQRTSTIAKLHPLDLTGAMCRSDDRIVGITMLYDGQVACDRAWDGQCRAAATGADDGGVWGLNGVDFATGGEDLWVPSSADPSENSFFAASEVGPDGSVWTGALLGASVFRPVP